MYVCIYMSMYYGYTTSVLPFLLGEQLSVPSFEKGQLEKTTVWANLKSFKKRLSKIKYGIEF